MPSHSSLGYRPPAPEAIQPALTPAPLTQKVVSSLGAGQGEGIPNGGLGVTEQWTDARRRSTVFQKALGNHRERVSSLGETAIEAEHAFIDS